MLIVVSPAKSLDFETPPTTTLHSQPEFLDQAEVLVELLREYSPAQLAELMSISDKLATLGVTRMAEWSRPFNKKNAKQAVLAFNGDVYEGLDAPTLDEDDLSFAQEHLRILSGLYGVLRPLDWMQAYRLEMGTKLKNPAGKDLYAFWGERITEALNAQLKKLHDKDEVPVLVNLASDEYFKSVKPKKLIARVVQPVFEDWKGSQYKIISFFAKRARGLMSRYAIRHRVSNVESLKKFDLEGYVFAPAVSDEKTWVFRRKLD